MSASDTKFLAEGDLVHIKRVAESYTPGIAYDTRWYEWTLKLLGEVEWHRKLDHSIADLRARFVKGNTPTILHRQRDCWCGHA